MSPEILIRENTEETYVYNNLIYVSSGAKMNILTNNDMDLNFLETICTLEMLQSIIILPLNIIQVKLWLILSW